MRLRNAVFGGRIAGIALLGTEFAPTADASLKLRTDFLPASLLEWISATGRQRRKDDDEEKRPGPHPLILETKLAFASG